MKDDGPYQAQGQLGVSIRDVIIPDVDQFDLKRFETKTSQKAAQPPDRRCPGVTDLSVFEEVQGNLDILQLVEAHSALFSGL